MPSKPFHSHELVAWTVWDPGIYDFECTLALQFSPHCLACSALSANHFPPKELGPASNVPVSMICSNSALPTAPYSVVVSSAGPLWINKYSLGVRWPKRARNSTVEIFLSPILWGRLCRCVILNVTCYYVASKLPVQLPAHFSAEQAVKAGQAGNAVLEKVRFS